MSSSPSVFKFVSGESFHLDSLANNYLWFSKLSEFNDPFEDIFVEHIFSIKAAKYDEKFAIKYLREVMRHDESSPQETNELLVYLTVQGKLEFTYNTFVDKFIASSQELYRSFVKSSFCCFNRDNTDEDQFALQNQLMWSHYAGGLRGFCIEFDLDTLRDSLKSSNNRDLNSNISYIKYGELEVVPIEDIMMNTMLDGESGHCNGNSIGYLTGHKSKVWAYENECRLIVDDGNIHYFDPAAIKGITIGEKMPDIKRKTLFSILRGNTDLDCPIYEMRINRDTFKLEQVELASSSRTVGLATG